MPTGRMPEISTSRAAAAATTARRGVRRLSARVGAIGVGVVTSIALLPGASLADPAEPELTIDEVRVQVDELYLQLERAAETANEARVRAEEVRDRLDTLRSNLERMQDDLDTASSDAGAFAAAQYRSAGLDPTLQLILSEEPEGFLTGLSQLSTLADRRARSYGALEQAKAVVAQQEVTIEREVTRLEELEAATAAAEDEAQSRLDEANALLDRLTAEEEARLEAARRAAEEAAAAAAAAAAAEEATPPPGGGGTPPPPPPPPGPVEGRAKIAVDFAMAQIGKPYSYGAAGPDAYDCSGLTMAAWAAAGVSLPHSSRAQAGMGTPVPADQLRPGDLVFYYSPISHVGMYIGNGMIVHSSNYSKPVSTAPLYSMPYSGAVRVG